MDRREFMADLYKQAQEFEKMWNKGQREEGMEEWPDELSSEEEWWGHLAVFLEMNGKI